MEDIGFRVDQIIEFSELQDFIHLPVRSYSQGMTMRLAFAIATSGSPDILLLDEWIGAGDASFLSKVEQRMRDQIDTSNILVLATHRNALLKQFCNKIILMNRGSVQFFGPLEEGLKLYERKYAVQKSHRGGNLHHYDQVKGTRR
jgi:lipopolysaccharide transport system ATP-binding protein